MVAGSRIESGTQILSASVRNTIQSIKEIVGNHTDAEIYVTLKETNMDPNETAQKLLNQDPFHEVRRKRDRKKENTGYKGLSEARKYSEHEVQGMKSYTSDRGGQRGGFNRNVGFGGSREFRIVRDNRVNHNVNREIKPPASQCSTSTTQLESSHVSEKGSPGASNNEKASSGHNSSQVSVLPPAVSNPKRTPNSSAIIGKEPGEERREIVPAVVSRVEASKPNNGVASNHSVVGVSSSSDPVHVPSPESRSSATVGAIRRGFGAVGVRRQYTENSVKPSSAHSTSLSNLHLGKDVTSSRELSRPVTATSKSEHSGQTALSDSIGQGKSFLTNQYNSRSHQQVAVHQKASQPNKEWKPKSRKTSSLNYPGVIGTPTKAKSVSNTPDNSKDLEIVAAQVQEKLLQGNSFENQNVIIAEHIRVSDSDRCSLTFGSFGIEFDSFKNCVPESHAVERVEYSSAELSTSLSASAPDSSCDETSTNKQVDVADDRVRNSDFNSPGPGAVPEPQLLVQTESSSPKNLDRYAEIGLVCSNSPSSAPSESQQHIDTPELSSFTVSQAYDSRTDYDMRYFRPAMDETMRSQGLPFPHEMLSSANNMPSSTLAMIHQQQQHLQQMAQLYPQVHLSHFSNLMPYHRQFLSPVYVPPMPMPGYSSNPTYPHPSNGSSYLLMPGSSTNNLKYGIQQFKPVPAASPTGFGNFATPTGYAINAAGVVGSAAGLEDSSRLKYKDGNPYVTNPQSETSEIWIQNPRELPNLQSASYYNMPQQTSHAAYMPSHTSFNSAAAVAQSSHMQFPGGLYHPPPTQQAPMANPHHHLGPAMGGNVGVGVAQAVPGAQIGTYQQPQLGHLNWATSF